MQTVTINFTVSGQTLTVTNPPIKIASNTVKYVKAVFALDSDWTGFDVASAIWYNDFAQIAVVLDENGECMIPHEVLAKPDDVMVNLVGRDIVNDELVDRLTTYPAKALDVDANAKITGTETAPVTPSQFEQYIAIVEQLVGSVKDIDHTELNADYTLTFYYTDGTSDTVGPIRGAQGETGNGILSAVLNPDYTLTLNYTNGQHDTVGPIRGAQGETGNGIQSIYLTGTSGAVKTYTILFTDGNTTEFQVTDGEVTNAVLEQVLPTDTASGAIASFPDGTDLFGAKSLVVEINPIQDTSGGDPSPTNICPISGWDSVETTVCGKNLFKIETNTTTYGGTLTVASTSGKIEINGTRNAYTIINYDLDVPIPANTPLTLSATAIGSGGKEFRLRNIASGQYTQINIGTTKTLTYAVDRIQLALEREQTYSLVISDIQLEKGSTATTYEAYNGTTKTVTLPTTTYGGSVDIVKGVLTVDRAIVDIGDLIWTIKTSGTYNGFYTTSITDIKYASSNVVISDTMADCYKSTQYSKGYGCTEDQSISNAHNGKYVYIVDSRFNDAQTFTSAMGNHKICYKLATPQAYQLTPQQISILKATNNIFADSGNVSVTYKADTQLWVEKKLSEL